MVKISILKSTFLIPVAAIGALAAVNPLVEITDFGSNPTNIGMFVYTPPRLAVPTPLIVAIHFCQGSAQIFFDGTQFANLADTHGFIVIFPNSAPGNGGCWDVHTNETLTHDAGGDSFGIANQVRFAIANLGVDPNQVFMTGSSSGAMMTNVLAGSYPDIFKAGVAFSGVPFSCFQGPDLWNNACANGEISMSPQEWGNRVRDAFPGYRGPRPRLQLWHGTNDTILFPENFGEEIKQWTNVFGVSQTPTAVVHGSPTSIWTRSIFGHNVMGLLGSGVGHAAPVNETEVLEWFGLTDLEPSRQQ